MVIGRITQQECNSFANVETPQRCHLSHGNGRIYRAAHQNAADHSLVAVGNSSWLPFNINTQPDFEAVPVKQSGVELMASEFNATMTMVVDYQ